MFVLDLFSGAGGLAEGFVAEGFTPVAHIEMDKDAACTLRTRAAYHYLSQNGRIDQYIKYLNKKFPREDLYNLLPQSISDSVMNEMLTSENFDSICREIDANMLKMGCSSIDVLIGGPPCQTYSVISRSMKNYENDKDQRNHLYKLYTRFLGRYTPKFFVFENVPGLMTIKNGMVLENLKQLISEQGYIVSVKALDASEFGVLQKRTRLIITGWRKTNKLEDIVYPMQKTVGTVVNDLLLDLPALNPGEHKDIYFSEPSTYLEESGIRNIDGIPLTLHACRNNNSTDREIYRIAARLWKDEGKRLVYSELPKNLITRKKPDIFKDKYKVVADDLPYSHTVIAHIAKDGHYYIYPSATQARSISVREAARIQSFPDDYYFEGARLKAFTQIGNAVPPLMSKYIARSIKEALNNAE